jgi:hypothetical protein
MRTNVWFLVLFFFLFFFSETSIYAQSGGKQLQALLLVGPQEDGTSSAIKEMNKIALLLSNNGVIVHKFYNRETDWGEIVKVAKDCNFLIYDGHGSDKGINGEVGGLCLKSDIISTDSIIRSLHLRKNSMVLFQSVCNGAGSSAGDDEDISINGAKARVESYAYPFFSVGASVYYANNYVGGVYGFLTSFFKGKSLYDAFDISLDGFSKLELDTPFSKDKSKQICLGASDSGGITTRTTYTNGVKKVEKVKSVKSYNVAMVGDKSFNLKLLKTF